MDGLVSISVMVPPDKIPELYEMCSRWIRELAEQQKKPMGWEPDDATALADARRLYSEVSPGAQKALDLWMGFPGDVFTVDELATKLGFTDVNKLTGTLSSIGRRARTAGRPVPYKRAGNKYWMTPDVADVFQQARKLEPPKEVPMQQEE